MLQNPKVLEKAYEAALNAHAEGSAQQELNKYLESIDGKIASFQNSWQDFQTSFLSSDFVKVVIDFGTKVIKFLDDIIDRFGTIGPLLVGGSGILSGAKGLGLIKVYKPIYINLCNNAT